VGDVGHRRGARSSFPFSTITSVFFSPCFVGSWYLIRQLEQLSSAAKKKKKNSLNSFVLLSAGIKLSELWSPPTLAMYRALAGIAAAAAVGVAAYTTYQKETERLVLEQMRLLMEQEASHTKNEPVMTLAALTDENGKRGSTKQKP
jgi:hypothetical protein